MVTRTANQGSTKQVMGVKQRVSMTLRGAPAAVEVVARMLRYAFQIGSETTNGTEEKAQVWQCFDIGTDSYPLPRTQAEAALEVAIVFEQLRLNPQNALIRGQALGILWAMGFTPTQAEQAVNDYMRL